MMTANEIRKKFLDFFASKEHKVIPSDSVIPKEDPTVLFTTAGMQQFKRQFLGNIRGFTRAASSQKCIRTDDLDQVGETAFHHTFFEMLGNFSFGDYFKKEAIEWAWEFLTKVVNIPEEKLWVSVYKDDSEAEKIWLEHIKIPKDKLVKLGDHSNFWPADVKEKGPNGPCGPCSEIFYDYGVNPDCPKGNSCDPSCDCGRFSEIWNLVFTQFNRKDGGVLEPLPKKNIDTGMGLERLTAVVQGKKSNFETDLFTSTLAAIDQELKAEKIHLDPKKRFVIADHIRAIVFSINDGVIPSNKERGSVVKRLITDITDILLRQGAQPFIHKLIPAVVDAMKEPYPELIKKMNDIGLYIRRTSEIYQKVFEARIPELKEQMQFTTQLSAGERDAKRGELIFYYKDTLGLTLTTIFMTMKNAGVPEEEIESAKKFFQEYMCAQQQRSRASSKMSGDVFESMTLNLNAEKTKFLGYDQFETESRILKFFKDGEEVSSVDSGDCVNIVLDSSPFYAESGGQIGDTGMLLTDKGGIAIENTIKTDDILIHIGTVTEGKFSVNDLVTAKVDKERRLSIMRNHTATHLLQAALRNVLGKHVRQQGSLVSSDRLRFDFTHPQSVTEKQIAEIEDFVNKCILNCYPVTKKLMSTDEAQKNGALAFFAEKYGSEVRVVSIDEHSKELCAGTHLDSTGQIGLFKITSESAIAQGIRRIEATTGFGAIALIKQKEEIVNRLSNIFKSSEDDLIDKATLSSARIRNLQKENEELRFENIKDSLNAIIDNAEAVKGTKIVSHVFSNIEITILRQISDLIKQKISSVVIILGAVSDENAYILAAASDDVIKKGIKANEIIQQSAPVMNGSGGGRPQLAQAGSKEIKKISQAVDAAKTFIKKSLDS